MKQKVLVILGPTATGKSHCAIEIAKKYNGEIISGDSMLVYKGMDIGTAKPTAEELAAVPHHLVDILPPDASFSVVDFKQQAERLITEITERGHLPILQAARAFISRRCLRITPSMQRRRTVSCARSWSVRRWSRAQRLCMSVCVQLLLQRRSVFIRIMCAVLFARWSQRCRASR